MVSVQDLISQHTYPSSVHSFAIWQMNAEKVTPLHLKMVLFRAKQKTSNCIAKSLILNMADKINSANKNGYINNNNCRDFSLPLAPMTSIEFTECLNLMSLRKRQCLLFLLESKLPLYETINLTWSQFYKIKANFNRYANDVVNAIPVRLGFPYVFWCDIDGKIGKLNRLEFDVDIIFGCRIPVLRDKYQKMIYLDHHSAIKHIKNIVRTR